MHYPVCPFCLSSLQVTDQQLNLKEGLIRCGHCQEVFNAKDTLANTTTSTSTQSKNPPNLHDVPLSAVWEEVTPSRPSELPYGLLSFVFALAFITQLIYQQANYLSQQASLQGTIHWLNQATDLNLPAYQDIKQFQVAYRQIRPHPKLAGVLMFQLSIKNNASISQAYPTINLTLTSPQGEPIAAGSFSPNHYLDNNTAHALFKANTTQHFTLYFQTPQQAASGFEITFSR